MSRRIFKVGINPTIIGKPGKSSWVNHATNWKNEELTPDELMRKIGLGHAFSAHFKDGYRKTTNFICSDVIAADIDHDWTIEELLGADFIREHAAFLYTTASHSPERHRVRVVFLVEKTITAATEWAEALAGLGQKLNADPSIKDAGRLFYGNPGATFHVLNRTLPASTLDELIRSGRIRKQSRLDPSSPTASLRSPSRINLDDEVRTASGELRSLKVLPRGTSVHCPHHLDRHHSAFVVRSATGDPGIHCMSCDMTFWAGDPGEYDFDAFDKLFEQRQREEVKAIQKVVEQSTNPLLEYFPPSPTRVIQHDQYLRPIRYQPGITLVKSPKGTGKTAALGALVSEIKSRDYLNSVARVDRCRSILLIGHRRSLIQEAAGKLGLDCYLDLPDRHPTDFYAICLDSLPDLLKPGRARKYDLVLIDESEQVLSHLTSETVAKNRGVGKCFHALQFFVRKAKAVVALDADLGLITAHAFKTLRLADWEGRCRIIYNKPPIDSSGKTLLLYKNRGHLIEDLRRSIRDGKRCFVTSNSKKMIATLSEMIRKEFEGKVSQLAITSENSRDPDSIDFLKRIPERFLEVQVLLASPSLGTGIDITFPGNASHVDCVYGFFVATVNTHTDIDQQLARVRHPGSVRVWLSPQKFNFETSFEVIRDDLARAHVVPSAVTGHDDDGRLQYDKDHPLLLIYSHVVRASRASKKNVLDLFCKLREAQGWVIKHVHKADAKSRAGNRRLHNATASVEGKRMQALINAPRLSDEEFVAVHNRLRKGEHVPRGQRFAHEKGLLERSLGTTLSPQIIQLNERGKLIEQVSLFSSSKGRYEDSLFEHLAEELIGAGTERRWRKSSLGELLNFLFHISGLLKDGEINADAIVSWDSLERFVSFCRSNRTIIEETIGDELRQDIGERAVMQLGALLRYAGLKLVQAKRRTAGGVQTREYRLDRARLDLMSRLASNYRPIEECCPELKPQPPRHLWAA
jgi:Origin of replication binding protein